MKNLDINRVPVRYKKQVLMPTTWNKARRLVRVRKAIWVNDKVLGLYLKLKYNPIGPNDIPNENQTLVLGMDPGSMFDGFTVVSESDQRNFQLNHQLAISKLLKSIMDDKKMYRKMRRSKLRHREARFEYRTGRKITNTSNYYYQNRVNMINRIINLYPIDTIAIEDVKFSHCHSNKGRSFSNIEVGKSQLYDYITKTLNFNLYKIKGKQSKEMREMIFPDRVKNKDKSIRNFDSHCIDSFVIGVLGLSEKVSDSYRFIIDLFNKNQLNKLNTSVRFIDRVRYMYRRKLYQLKNKVKDSKFYLRYKKGGNKIKIHHYSRLRKLRIRLPGICRSYHGNVWRYMYNDPKETYKKFRSRYGGTVAYGKSRYGNIGSSKYWNEMTKNFIHYNLSIN